MRCPTRTTAGAVLGLLLAGATLAAPAAQAATPSVPYNDPGAVGSIGFCNQAGQQVTHGSISSQPFVWRAVSTQPAASPYDAAGRTATLYAYQPLQVLAPGDWSGAQLTAATRYENVAHPTAVSTAGDGSLANFIGQFAPKWDGLLQIRMFLDAPNLQVNSLTYPATTIKVTRDTWSVVSPVAAVSCTSGPAVSVESLLLPAPAVSHGGHAPHPANSGTPTEQPSGTPASSPKPSPLASSSLAASAASDSSGSSGGHTGLVVGLVAIVVVVVVGGAGFLIVRRRGQPTTGRG